MRPTSVAAAALVVILTMPSGARAGGELTLKECVTRALATIPRLAEAGAAVDLSDAQRREVAASLWPTVHSDIQYLQEPGYRVAITNRGISSGQLIADYLVYDGGRRLSQLHAAKYNEQASQLGLAAARNQVVFDTTSAFYNLIHASQLERELRSSGDRLARYTAVVQALRATGRATANDFLRIDVILQNSRVQLNGAIHNRARGSLALGALIGEYGRQDLPVVDPHPEELSKPVPGGVDGNPTLRAFERSRAGTSKESEAARAERYPTFRLGLSTGFLGTDPQSTLRNYLGASYGGIVSMPLFDGGAIRARIDQAGARVHQADAQLAQARIDLAERLAEARSRYDEARHSVTLLADSLPAADGSFELSWARFLGGGTATLLEVIDSYSQALATRLALTDQRLAAQLAAAEIAQLTGTGIQ